MNAKLVSPVRSILFVCMGNICRSPAGENVMRKMLEDAGLDREVRVDSAGTTSYHVGEAPDRRMRAAAEKRGMKYTGRSRAFDEDDFHKFDLILAMDDSNYRDILALATGSNDRNKVKRFVEFCTEHNDLEVPDPYYGGPQGFDYVIDLVEDGCRGILRMLTGKA